MWARVYGPGAVISEKKCGLESMSHADIMLTSCKLVTHWEAGQCTACNVYEQFSIFAMVYIWVNLIHVFVFWVCKPPVTLCIRTLACFVSMRG